MGKIPIMTTTITQDTTTRFILYFLLSSPLSMNSITLIVMIRPKASNPRIISDPIIFPPLHFITYIIQYLHN